MARRLPVAHTKKSREDSPSDAKSTTDDDHTLEAYGDLSMSEAYNAPAPTTGNYPLKLKRGRPPKPKKVVKSKQFTTPTVSSLTEKVHDR